MDITAISLFSGIGGDTLAAEWAGFKTLCFVEWDLFCQAVLRKHWPDIPIFGDIDEFDAKQYKGITLVYGGDPCQPNSVAGKRKGTEDNRYKWPSMLRVIRESKPTWVVNENPTGRLTMDFYQVLSDLEGEGYETRSFVIPACAVNAPHRRDRVYIVAYSERCRNSTRELTSDIRIKEWKNKTNITEWSNRDTFTIKTYSDVANSTISGFQGIQEGEFSQSLLHAQRGNWEANPLEVAAYLCRVDDGFPSRVDRLKTLGNAQVPQQIYPIFKGIADIERMKAKKE